MCPLFAYAGYAAARAPVEAKKKRDLSSFHTYAVFLSLGLIFDFFQESFFLGGGWLSMVGEGKPNIYLKLFSLHFCLAAARPPVKNEEKTRYIIISQIHSVSQL